MLEIKDCEVMGFRMAIKGMRNAMNSWNKSDSEQCRLRCSVTDVNLDFEDDCNWMCGRDFMRGYTQIGPADMKLAKSLIKAGSSDRKFLRMIHVQVDVLAPLYFWKEADQYKIGTTTNSCSTMHTLHKRELTIDDFSHEHLTSTGIELLEETIDLINDWRDWYVRWDELHRVITKEITSKEHVWYQMIQLLPSSYNQLRTWDLDYETLLSIYFQRRNHKLNEWVEFCKWIKTLPYMKEFISVLDKKEESNDQCNS